MKAKKCDRCGQYYDYYRGSLVFKGNGLANGFRLLDEDGGNVVDTRNHYDLCQECMKKLMDFIKQRDEPGVNSN